PAANGEQALALFQQEKFDLVLLDIMMPRKSGYDVCKAIRATNEKVPIIMLTAKSEEIDKVLGLQLGADDYITKPFGVRELLARIASVLRRTQRNEKQDGSKGSQTPDQFMIGSAEIDTRRYQARLGRKTSELSAREIQLLQFFRAHPNEVLSRDQLLSAIWGMNYLGTTRTLDQHIAQLRKKIEPRPDEPQFIITVHGVGYRYENIKSGKAGS
ncbi:MAG: response regulator transcription factor, partial [Lentisphaerae bacterium]|nr:response regulator transcription factor [Lentisphaerota bacterium]